MGIKEFIQNRITVFDGAMGTLLQERGLKQGELPERWNVTHKADLIDIHLSYLLAGSDVITANTFGANLLKYDENELESLIKNAVENCKKAIELSGLNDKFIALDIGPCGKLLKPFGDLDFQDAVSIFSKTAILGEKYGADLVIIETMNDLYETKAAVLGVKENVNLPIFVSNAYSKNNKLMTGASVSEVVCTLTGLGVDAIGANCSFGPNDLVPVISELLAQSSLPTIFMPNAGLPSIVDGKTVYDISPNEFAKQVGESVKNGVRIVGGCCGTTPEHVKALKAEIKDRSVKPIRESDKTVICSGVKTVEIGKTPIIIGERINPTGKKRFKQALIEKDISYILQEGIDQQEKGANVLDVNVGIPDVDETELMVEVVKELQAVVDLPLQIDTSNIVAMERAMRIYNGKPIINSVNGKKESMDAVFPLVKKYGGVVVCLTLDESGIPSTARGRLEIAKKILDRAKEYGISQNDLIFDTLCMTVSTDKRAGQTTVDALKLVKNELGGKTVLGISNVSFGLPDRESVNASFLSLALSEGLSCAIINPFSLPVMQVMRDFNGKKDLKPDFSKFVEDAINSSLSQLTNVGEGLQKYIVHGQKLASKSQVEKLLTEKAPLDIVNEDIIPALDTVGKLYEQGKVYLPQLLMSAEASKSAFEVIKNKMINANDTKIKKCKFVIATVSGDIHDIGKNIVKLLLENYGFDVIDLGKDTPCQAVVDKVIETKAPLCGLSALMTTTVPSMEKTVKLLKEQAPWCKVVVGGAVLTQEYADKMGADKYAKDALSTVRFAEQNSK